MADTSPNHNSNYSYRNPTNPTNPKPETLYHIGTLDPLGLFRSYGDFVVFSALLCESFVPLGHGSSFSWMFGLSRKATVLGLRDWFTTDSRKK